MNGAFFSQLPGIGIHQKRKLFELRNEYTLVDQSGTTIGTANQERQSILTFLARLGSDLDVTLPSTIVVRDAAQMPVLEVHKPWFTTTVSARTPDGQMLGSVKWKVRLGKRRFALLGPQGEELGEVHAQNWRARDFRVFDTTGSEVARVTKKWRGLFTEAFTDADSYAVEFNEGLSETLRALAFTAAVAVDLVMKQKDSS
ncbi:MAG: hypothetical protein GEU74_09660 [Nitriliruptorales bacterium]|nr:hypothetical protein [Nitriliruptorales bacterium]